MKKIFKHKFIILIILILICIGGYFFYTKSKKTEDGVQYNFATVKKGSLIVSVSGTGQIESLDKMEITPQVSAKIKKVYVNEGENVKANQLLFELDSKDVEKEIKNIEEEIKDLKYSLSKSEKTQKEEQEDLRKQLDKSFEAGFNNVSNTFSALPDIITALEDMATKNSHSTTRTDLDYYYYLIDVYINKENRKFPKKDEIKTQFDSLKKMYEESRDIYLKTDRLSDKESLKTLFNQTYSFLKTISDFTRANRDNILLYKEAIVKESISSPISETTLETHLSNLNSFTNSLSEMRDKLLSNIETIENLETSIKKSEEDYEDDLRTQQKNIKQKEENLAELKESLEDYYVYSPFNGMITEVSEKAKEGESVSQGTTLATLITNQKIAKISLNEIDAAKVKTNQKVNLTFDALPDLNLTGRVVKIDATGTVSQGVVSYGVEIALDLYNEKIKSGMSVTADIIINSKKNVLLLPNNAIKSNKGINSVQILDGNNVRFQKIEVGLSNDTMTEIISGLKEGDRVILSTSQKTNQNNQAQRTQGFQMPGMGGQMRGFR